MLQYLLCSIIVNYKNGPTRLAAASDKVYQLFAHGRWFSPGTPACSTTNTGRHDIAESDVKHNKSLILSKLHNLYNSFLQNHVINPNSNVYKRQSIVLDIDGHRLFKH